MSLAEFAGRYSNIAGVIAAAGALPMFFLKWRTGFLGLSVKRTQRLYALSLGGAWRHADAAALQIAVGNAIGGNLDGDEIRIALERSNAVRVLTYCKMAKGMIGVSNDKSRFVPKGHWTSAGSYRKAAIALYVAAFVPWLLAPAAFNLFEPSKQIAGGISLAMLLLSPVLAWLSACAEAAYRLTSDFDQKYPRLQQLPASKGRTRAARTKRAGAPQPSAGRPRRRLRVEAQASSPIGQLTPVPPSPQ
ncbi:MULTISPECIES: hypothetical protein [Xanthomonas]|uniref:hypothetical protein n=1 Tax=Xanthomonas TaxID=338 RepID=UPI001ADCF6B6|nr:MULTISPECIES: hypothetical protein [unclassified Xanthomonas]MBO9873606.1 hypothetical protein [Xanthomonas sp. D-93]WNH44166.1 hypothetical protein PG878_16835 [Xanthomonas sp. A6251]